MGEAAIKGLAREQQKELRTMARGIAGRDVADAQNPARPSAGARETRGVPPRWWTLARIRDPEIHHPGESAPYNSELHGCH